MKQTIRNMKKLRKKIKRAIFCSYKLETKLALNTAIKKAQEKHIHMVYSRLAQQAKRLSK